MKIGVPVKCHNGHRAIWVIEVDGLDVIHRGVPDAEKCGCPKHEIGQGYSPTGEPSVLGEPLDDSVVLDPWGLLTPHCPECGDRDCNGECSGDGQMGD